MAIVAVVTFAAGAAGAAAPAPFPMPLDSGTKYVAQAADARAELANAQPEIRRIQQRQRTLQAQYDDLTAQLVALDAQEQAAAVQVQAARDRIAEVGGQAVHAGRRHRASTRRWKSRSTRTTCSTMGRNLHILEKSGTHELDMFALLDAAHTQVVTAAGGRVAQQASAKHDLDAAIEKVKDCRHPSTARSRLAEAERDRPLLPGGHDRGEPDHGAESAVVRRPGRVRAGARRHAQLSVSLDALAQIYLEEGQKVGVRGDVAFAQSILETGWFGFNKSMVDPEDNNFAGVGACDTCKGGFHFPDARTGVRAQVQLLRVYVDRAVGPRSLADPLLLPGTLRLGFRGRVQTWWDLTGTWATASNYGNAVYAVYNRMVAASGRR